MWTVVEESYKWARRVWEQKRTGIDWVARVEERTEIGDTERKGRAWKRERGSQWEAAGTD